MKTFTRRQVLELSKNAFGIGSLMLLQGSLVGCSNTNFSSSLNATDSTNGSSTTEGLCVSEIPSETAGPYPAHDDSALNCLRFAGIVRSDMRASLNTGGYAGTAVATGVPLTLNLSLTDASNCTNLTGYAVYLWHCDKNGNYSMYSSAIVNETYLRAVQVTDASGQVSFKTIFPGCYDGRMTHMHFEIFPTLASAVDNNYSIKTSQLTFPMSAMNAVYATSGYSTSKTNLSKISYATDNVFSDGYSNQLATVTGDVSSGLIANLKIAI